MLKRIKIDMSAISIIIPCYNMELYIERCFHSIVVQQDTADVEIIFVNDGSTDNTLHLLNQIKDKDQRVVVIDQPNAGVSAARNRALEIATGEYFFLLDSDDYLPPHALSLIKEVIVSHHPDIIMPTYNKSIAGVEHPVTLPLETGLYDKHSFFSKVVSFPTIPQLVYKKQSKHDSIRFDESVKCGEVYTFTINYLQHAQTIYVLNKPCYNYFQRMDSATQKPHYKNDMTVVDALQSIYQQGGDLCKYASFSITAFKLFMSFTYNKYLRFPLQTEAIKIVEKLFACPVVRQNIKEVLLRSHASLRERCLACYVYVMPIRLGFKLLNKIISKNKK